MRKLVSLELMFAATSMLVVFSACNIVSSAKPLAATSPTIIYQTPEIIPGPTMTPTVSASETPIIPSSTVTLFPSITAMPTQRGATTTARVTPIVAPPGVYVSAITIEPTEVRSDQSPQFSATFVNTTAQAQTYRWFIKVFAQDQSQSFGETPKLDSTIPTGVVQIKATSEWKTRTFFVCLWFVARAFWVDTDNHVVEFAKPNGPGGYTSFSVCP
jgi:hypothetical protein